MGKLRLFIEDRPLHFTATSFDPRLEIWPDPWGDEYGFGLPRGSEYWMKVHHVGAFVIQAGYQDIIGFPEAGLDAAGFREAFFHGVAPWLLQRRQWDCLHGSAVLTERGVVVFCGHSGRGKSTLARAWVDRGAAPYADDAVPFLVRDGVPMSARIPQRIRLREPAASHFSDADGWETDPAAGREVFYDLEPTLRPLRSIYWLEPRTKGTNLAAAAVKRIPSSRALPLMLSVAHCMSMRDPDCNRKMVRNYLSLAQLTPTFRFSYAFGLARIPAVLDRLEQNERELGG